MRFRRPDPVAVVTGGGSGIGEATCRLLANLGVRVVVVDVVENEAVRVATALGESGAEGSPVVADIRRADEVARMIDHVRSRYGHLDVLVNNAGVWWPMRDDRVTDLDVATWQEVLDINLTGTFLVCKAGIGLMLEGDGGAVVNIASSAGVTGWAGMDAYTASKGAVVALTRSLAVEYGPTVRVNAVCPGAIETPLTIDAQRRFGHPSNPLGRVGLPDDIAWPVAFLASEASGYLTGEYLMVDGGRRASL